MLLKLMINLLTSQVSFVGAGSCSCQRVMPYVMFAIASSVFASYPSFSMT